MGVNKKRQWFRGVYLRGELADLAHIWRGCFSGYSDGILWFFIELNNSAQNGIHFPTTCGFRNECHLQTVDQLGLLDYLFSEFPNHSESSNWKFLVFCWAETDHIKVLVTICFQETTSRKMVCLPEIKRSSTEKQQCSWHHYDNVNEGWPYLHLTVCCLQMTPISKPTRGWKMDPLLRRIIQFDKKSQNSVGVTRGTTSPNMSKIRQLSAKIDTSEPLSFFVDTHGTIILSTHAHN